MFFSSGFTFDWWKNAGQLIVGMCITLLQSAKMSACDGMGYALGSIILLRNLMSTIVRPLRVPSTLDVHITKHGYVNSLVWCRHYRKAWTTV